MKNVINQHTLSVGEEFATISVKFNIKDGITVSVKTDTIKRLCENVVVGQFRYDYQNFFENNDSENIKINSLFFNSNHGFNINLYFYSKLENVEYAKTKMSEAIMAYIDENIEIITNDINRLREWTQ
ncbi:hypothetical protein VmeM32_00076 [Vibrio phage vB_VmeM-32]|nr:hypothetical protein VmeM32_00076 [Vibrio phage vB_VmeM-32]